MYRLTYIAMRVKARSGAMRSSSIVPSDLVSGEDLTPESVAKSRMTMIGAAEDSVSCRVWSPGSGVVSALAGLLETWSALFGVSPSLSSKVATVLSRRSSLPRGQYFEVYIGG